MELGRCKVIAAQGKALGAFATGNRYFAVTADGMLWLWGAGHYSWPAPRNYDQHVPIDVNGLLL